MIDKVKRFFRVLIFGKTKRHKFYHNHNLIYSTHEKDIVLASRKIPFDFLGIEEVKVLYHDGVMKSFTSISWPIHGNEILKNCKNIRIIIIEKNGYTDKD